MWDIKEVPITKQDDFAEWRFIDASGIVFDVERSMGLTINGILDDEDFLEIMVGDMYEYEKWNHFNVDDLISILNKNKRLIIEMLFDI